MVPPVSFNGQTPEKCDLDFIFDALTLFKEKNLPLRTEIFKFVPSTRGIAWETLQAGSLHVSLWEPVGACESLCEPV